jgi:hypothetical protein
VVEHAIAVQNRKLSQGLAFDPPKLLFGTIFFYTYSLLKGQMMLFVFAS